MSRGIKLSFVVSLGFCILSGISLFVLSSPKSSAIEVTASASANATVSVAEACTMYEDYNTYVPHTASIPAGTNKSDIGLSTFRVICNDSEGFSVYAVGYANYELGNTKLLATVGGTLNPTYDIETGLSMDTTTSAWAMKLESVSGTYTPTIQSDTNGSFASYHVVPATNTKVATFAGVTDGGNNASGSAFTATYRANISGAQPAGNYNGIVKYTMVHPENAVPVEPLDDSDCPANNVCYAPNSYDVVGTMVSVTNINPTLTAISANAQAAKQSQTRTVSGSSTFNSSISSASTIELLAPNYSRSGYGFVGWSPDFNATSSSTIYGPEETIEKPTSIATQGLILYPVWVKSTGSLQDWSGCSSLTKATYNSTTGKMNATLDSVAALTDLRDGNTYAVARLSDDNCWMIENLRLEAANSSNASLAQGYGTSATYGNFTGLATAENANFSNTNPPLANSLYSTGGSTTNTIQGGNSSYYYARMPRYNNNNSNRTLGASYNGTGSTTYYHWYSYGNYYTWAAAIASVIEYGGPTTQAEGKTSETANTSLCPAGWRLPYGRNIGNGATTKGFSYLDTTMGGSGRSASSSTTPTGQSRSEVWRSFPNNFIYSGYFAGASADDRGTYGYYRSSTSYDTINYYGLRLERTNLHPGTHSGGKNFGNSIRCVAGS